MNNIIFEKVWQDSDLIELKIIAESEFVTAYQSCYIQQKDLEDVSDKISIYANKWDKELYLEMGNKEGDFTPAFSMKLEQANTLGHLKIEVDIEIADNNYRSHRCCYYVESELGAIERFGIKLKELAVEQDGTKCVLYE